MAATGVFETVAAEFQKIQKGNFVQYEECKFVINVW